jgi:hypothetical protein
MYQKRLIMEGARESNTGDHCVVEMVASWGAAVLRPYMTVPAGCAAM